MVRNRQRIRSRGLWRFPVLLRRGLTAWILAAALAFLLLPRQLRDLSGLDGLRQMSFGMSVALTLGIFAGLCLLSALLPTGRWEGWGMVLGAAVLFVCALTATFSWALLVTCLLLMLLLLGFTVWGWDGSPEPGLDRSRGKRRYPWIAAGLTLGFFLFVSLWTVGRVYSFNAPSYDFGIFSQMFHYLRKTGLPLTTLERDGLLSHFAVHVSPIYYLMLPFYALAPYPATLQILQGAVLASAVVPAWKIGKQHGLPSSARLLVCAMLLLYPAYSGGTSYDLHENCFLTPLLLWLLYGIDRGNLPLTALAAALTLTVKEDAAVYVAVVALWLMVRGLLRKERRNLWTGLGLFAGALLWFFLVTGYLSRDGEGVMTYRYKNFFFKDSASLYTLLQAVFMSPMKAVYECVDPEKLEFLLLTLQPLLGLPLWTRRYERYLLLIPYVLVNLMSDYQYQHSIFYQYTFGSTALLLYLTIVNLADFRVNWQRLTALGCAVAVSVACFGLTVLPRGLSYPRQCLQYRTFYQNIRNALSEIPEEASVAATTFYTVQLSQRDILYDVRYCSTAHLLEAEYVALNVKSTTDYKKYNTNGQNNGFANLVTLLTENGYQPYRQYGSNLIIYHKES